jgi:hypothetical protein
MRDPIPGGPRRRAKAALLAALTVWAAAVVVTFGGLTSYAAAPAPAQAGPEHWPDEAGSLDPDRLTLVMWVHPRCPCTRASATELAELMAHVSDRVRAIVLVATPEDAPEGWSRTGLVAELAAIPGVEVVVDHGRMQRRFGATTSGEVRLYAPSGVQLFAGGITAGRGHEGDNPGRAAIEIFALGAVAPIVLTPTYGCGLADT